MHQDLTAQRLRINRTRYRRNCLELTTAETPGLSVRGRVRAEQETEKQSLQPSGYLSARAPIGPRARPGALAGPSQCRR